MLFDYQIKKNEMGGIRDTYGGEERCKYSFGGATYMLETNGKIRCKLGSVRISLREI
jgi:hypothetical protein